MKKIIEGLRYSALTVLMLKKSEGFVELANGVENKEVDAGSQAAQSSPSLEIFEGHKKRPWIPWTMQEDEEGVSILERCRYK